jgi:molybdopterin-guanine dinucleotide biosynthesis protein A
MKASGIILAGGRGLRVNGADKGLLPWGQGTLVEAAIKALQPQVDDILISANRNMAHYQSLGYSVVSDTIEGYQGPLAGILAALPQCRQDVAVIIPCDSPTLPGDLADRLLAPLQAEELDLSFVHDGSRDQYLLTAVKLRCLDNLQRYLLEGGRSVRGWHQHLHCQAVDFSDCPDAFLNLNTHPQA